MLTPTEIAKIYGDFRASAAQQKNPLVEAMLQSVLRDGVDNSVIADAQNSGVGASVMTLCSTEGPLRKRVDLNALTDRGGWGDPREMVDCSGAGVGVSIEDEARRIHDRAEQHLRERNNVLDIATEQAHRINAIEADRDKWSALCAEQATELLRLRCEMSDLKRRLAERDRPLLLATRNPPR